MGEKFQKHLGKHKCCIEETFVTQTVLKPGNLRKGVGSRLRSVQSDKAAQAKQREEGGSCNPPLLPRWPSAFLPCEPRAGAAVGGEISPSSISGSLRGENLSSFILGTSGFGALEEAERQRVLAMGVILPPMALNLG